MAKLSNAQIRKIFYLKKERGLDDELLRSFIYTLVGKSSIKSLTMREAITVIDALDGKQQVSQGRLSTKQQKYIEGLAVQCGWIGDDERVDMKRLNAWLEKRYKVSSILWLTPKNASDAIEGLKAMIGRKKKEAI